MAEPVSPEVIVYICCNSLPDGARLPRQWRENGVHVAVRQVPCSGKIDVQYIFHALEGGSRGVCVVTCPAGQCRLAQGNYRAAVRIGTVRRLLAEIGIEPDRAELIRRDADQSAEEVVQRIRRAVGGLCALGESPLAARR